MISRYDESMKSKPYLPFHMGYLNEALIEKAREELGESEEVKARTILELRKKVEDEPNLVGPTDDAYLLQYLRARKYNVKKAFALLQNYYKVKKAYGDIYDSISVEVLKKIFRTKAVTYSPYRDEDGCAIYLIVMSRWDSDYIPIKEAILALTTNILFGIEDTATQVSGVRLMLDVQGTSLKHIRCLSPRYITLFSKALRNCLPARFKGIHIYNETVIFGYFWSVMKLFLSEKIKNRVHFHGDNQKYLHKFIPKAILPSEYGGDNTQFFSSDWFYNEIEPFFERMDELSTYGYRD